MSNRNNVIWMTCVPAYLYPFSKQCFMHKADVMELSFQGPSGKSRED